MGPEKSKRRRPQSGGPREPCRSADWKPDPPAASQHDDRGRSETWPEPPQRQAATDARSSERRPRPEEDDELWDVFLPDEQDVDPLPEESDFWVDEDDPPQW